MTDNRSSAPIERWRLWLCRLLILPLAATSGGFLFVLYRIVVTGQITTVSKGYVSPPSRVIYFADSPVWFSIYFLLPVMFTCVIIFVTVLVVRLAFKKSRPS